MSWAAQYEAATRSVVSHGIDEADIPVLYPTANNFQGRHDPAGSCHHVGKCRVDPWQIVFKDQGDFSLDLRLQY
ncbi:hypothetical protein D3C86_2037660 [compost metagenome]